MLSMLVAGCSNDRTDVSPPQNQQQTFLIGLVPEQDIFKQIRRYEPLADYLSRQLNVRVALIVIPSYEKAVDFFKEKKLDAAFLGSMTYILAHTRLGVEPIARPVSLDGTSTYYGVMFVRADSKIRSVQDMKGKRLAMVEANTMAGYLLPLAYFTKKGINYTTYLKEFYFAGTHEDAIYDILDRKADIGAAKSTVLIRLAAEDPRVQNDLLILTRTPAVPDNCLAVRQDLSATRKEELRSALLKMHEDQAGAMVLKEFKARKFIETSDSDFKSVYFFARELDIDLNNGHEPTVR